MRTNHLESIKNAPCGRPRTGQKRTSRQDIPLQEIREKTIQKLNQYLKLEDLKQSAVRLSILDSVLDLGHHFTIAQLTKKIHSRFPKIGPATVYRNLPILVRAGILQETLKTEQGQTYYELAHEDHHDHIVCVDCGRIFEFHEPTIEKEQERVAQQMHFRPKNHLHVIYAKCEYKK